MFKPLSIFRYLLEKMLSPIKKKPLETYHKHYNTFDDKSILSFDELLNKVDFGFYQIRVYIIMSLMALSEGAQIISFTLMIPILKLQWDVSDFLNSLQASLIFISFLIGSLISGPFSKKFGRKTLCIYSSLFMTFFSLLSSSSSNIYMLIILRVFAGFLVGFFGPLAATLLTEITPKHLRGKYMTILTFSLVAGQLYGGLLGYFLLINLGEGNWRVLIIMCSLPGLISFLISFYFLEESARYLFLTGDYKNGKSVTDRMAIENNTYNDELFNDKNYEKVINWAIDLNIKDDKIENGNFKTLFQEGNKKITLILWLNWFTSSFIYYGIVVYMPYILHIEESKIQEINENTNSNDILKIFWSNLIEILSVFLAASVIENKHFGRKNSMILFYFLTSFISLVIFFCKANHFVIFVTIARFFLSITFIFCFQYSSEVYHTKIRTTGLGFANGIGRIGGILMPWICIGLVQVDLYGPFLAFFILAGISSFASFFFPFDTTGKELDS